MVLVLLFTFFVGSFLSKRPKCAVGVPNGAYVKKTKEGRIFVEGEEISRKDCEVSEVESNGPSNAWVSRASFTASESVRVFVSSFNVPENPPGKANILYLFPGLQDYGPGGADNAELEILQPVLSYRYSEQKWYLSSCYVSSSEWLYSPYMPVSPGEVLVGNMTRTGETSYVVAGYVKDDPSRSTVLNVDRPPLKDEPWACVTVELYGDQNDCSLFPTSDHYYNDFTMVGDDGKAIELHWKSWKSTPCVTDVEIEGDQSQVTFHFKN